MFILACAGSGLHAQTCSCVLSLYLCVRRLVLACMYLFFSLCTCKFQPTYACSFLRTQDPSCAHMAPGKNPSLGILAPFFIYFSSFCNFKIIPHHFCISLYASPHISLYCESSITFPPFFPPNHEFNFILFCRFQPIFW